MDLTRKPDISNEPDIGHLYLAVTSSLSTPKHDDSELFRDMNAIVGTVTVKTQRLETALRELQAEHGFKRPFLKMDTQGFDVKIVKSSGDIMRNFVGLQSELAIAKLYADSVDFRDALTEYERCGFLLSAFVPNNAGHFPRLLETDCVMIRSDLAGVVSDKRRTKVDAWWTSVRQLVAR